MANKKNKNVAEDVKAKNQDEEKKVQENGTKNENEVKDNKPVVTQKEIEKKLKRANNDKIIILSIVIGALVIAFAIFGVYFYKTNFQAVVTYDGGKVTKAEYTLYYKRFANMLINYYGYPESMVPNYLAQMAASDEILLNDAKAAGITLSEENKKLVDDMLSNEEELAAIKSLGIDVSTLRKMYYNQYIVLQYINKLANDASDEDVLNYIKAQADADETLDLNQYNTRHILFKTVDSTGKELSEEDAAKAKANAEAALARVLAGEDFATVAKELSEDAGTKEDGGAFDMYMDGRVLEEYVEAVKTLQPGQIYATLVKTDAGYHIIKLESIVENGRAKNPTEREYYANTLADKVGETKNIQVNTKELNKLIEELTGKKVEEETNSTTNDTENNAEGNDTINNETTNNTTQE